MHFDPVILALTIHSLSNDWSVTDEPPSHFWIWERIRLLGEREELL
jgi:hypothetical protein